MNEKQRKALEGNGLRRRLFDLIKASEAPASQGKLAQDLNEPVSRIRYHASVLVDAGLIEVARRSLAQNEPFYRAVPSAPPPSDDNQKSKE